MSLSWQTQVTLALMVVGGGYLAYVNKFPPFNSGGLVDQLKKYMPQSDTAPGENAANGGNGNANSQQEPVNHPSPFPVPGQPQQGGQGQGPLGQMPYMDNPLPARPTWGDETVYNDYATALRMMYGQGNNPNLGGVGGNGVFGDPNLGTTPVDPNLFGLNGSQGSSQPPPYPFLPSPFTPNNGMYRPPPDPPPDPPPIFIPPSLPFTLSMIFFIISLIFSPRLPKSISIPNPPLLLCLGLRDGLN